MKVFIDFDDVIFNTKKFKDDLVLVFLRFGVTQDLYEKSYFDPEDGKLARAYDPYAQIKRLVRLTDIDEDAINKALHEFMKTSSDYVFPDVKSFAMVCGGSKNLYVVSYGDVRFQEEKINSSGIKDFIDNIFITDKLKTSVIRDVLGKGDVAEDVVFFLDDRVEQINNVKKIFPGIKTILVKRPEGRYQEMEKEGCCDFEVANLKEAERIILQ